MGNCANKPLTEEGGAPAPEEKPVETTEREIVLDQPKEEQKKPEAVEPAKAEASAPEKEEIKPAVVAVPAAEKNHEEKKPEVAPAVEMKAEEKKP